MRLSRPEENDASFKIDRKAFFNQAASSWDAQFVNADLADFLKTLVHRFNLALGQKILDLGAGTGILIPYLVRAVGPSGLIVAIDFAEKMVEISRRKYSGLSNVKIELQWVEELDFPQDYFDAITCFGLFPHIEDKQRALLKMNRVLKLEGKLVIAHALSSHEMKVHHRQVSSVVANDVMPKDKEMKRLLERAGFVIAQIEDEPGCYLCIVTKMRRV